MTDDWPAVTVAGSNETPTPAGAPVADSVIVSAVPPISVVFTVAVADSPALTVPDAGFTDTENPCEGRKVH
jgi:hypothetical protein